MEKDERKELGKYFLKIRYFPVSLRFPVFLFPHLVQRKIKIVKIYSVLLY